MFGMGIKFAGGGVHLLLLYRGATILSAHQVAFP